MKTTHLFKHDKQYYAKSSVVSAHVRYEYTFDTKLKTVDLYPWYLKKENDLRSDWYDIRKDGYGISIDNEKNTMSFGNSHRSLPYKTQEDVRRLKITSTTIIVRLKNGSELEYDVSNQEDKLFAHSHYREDQEYRDPYVIHYYDATNISSIYRIQSSTKYNELIGYHYSSKHNPTWFGMDEPLNQNYNMFDVMVDESTDMMALEYEIIEGLVEQYAQRRLDDFVEENL
jgi:hypothetical protein